MYKNIISGNFSKSASSYDDHAEVQKECARKLLTLIKRKHFPRILEIGCGTGVYTHMLSKKYSDSEIVALDISDEMIKIAREKVPKEGIDFISADGEQIEVDGKFDLITSNASFQWFENLGTALRLFAGSLAEDGLLCFSMYGPETFKELEEVFKHHFGRRRWLSSAKFNSREETEERLKKHFKDFDIKEEHFTVDFFSLWDFLRNIKHTGTRGEGLSGDIFLGKYMMRELERTYIDKFGGIKATHHVYFCKAKL